MNNHEKRIQQYEEMDEELHKIQKAIRMVWRRQELDRIDEFRKEASK